MNQNPFKSTPLGILFKTPVRWKRNTTQPLIDRARIARVVRRHAPEVMVKVKRGGKSVGHIKAHFEYITRRGKLDGENERGEVFSGKEGIDQVMADWTGDAEVTRAGSRNTINVILSMPPGTSPTKVKDAVRDFAKQELGNYQYLFVLHTDDAHPHCHLSIKTLGFNGKKLDPRKEDLQVWREVFAAKLREHEVSAEATYRPTRGIIAKPLLTHEYHMQRRGVRSENQVLRVQSAIGELVDKAVEWASEAPKKIDPWDEQRQVRQSWAALENALRASNVKEDEKLAGDVAVFIASLPQPMTRHQLIQSHPEVQRKLLEIRAAKSISQPSKPELDGHELGKEEGRGR